MNCKPGDLAVIVRSFAGNEGKIVRCVRYVGVRRWHGPDKADRGVHTWEIDRKLRNCFGDFDDLMADDQLRPIRDNPGEDETLTLAGKPEQVAA